MMSRPAIYGLMAEFETPEKLVAATRRTREAGYRRFDAYSPYPIEGMSAALGLRGTWIPFTVFLGGLVGGAAGFFMQSYSMGVDYRFNSGGRPYLSWPVFIPITFEVLILVASLSAVLGLLFLCGLPAPYHPVFNVPQFARASQDRFFLCIEASDPRFEIVGTNEFLNGLGASGAILEVPLDPPSPPGQDSEEETAPQAIAVGGSAVNES